MIPAGILLTGGASRRMGADKATLVVGEHTLAVRTARILAAVCDPAIEVGGGVSGLPATREEPAGTGPLAALLAGARYAGPTAADAAFVVVACDLPHLSEVALRRIADHPGNVSVVPVVADRPQWACARWSPAARGAAERAFAAGARGLRVLGQAPDLVQLAVDDDAEAFTDVDDPDALRALRDPPGDPAGAP